MNKYIARAYEVAKNSPDPTTKTGVVIVDSGTGEIIAEGWNNKFGDQDPRKKFSVHAEMDAVFNLPKPLNPVGALVVYSRFEPCLACLLHLNHVGIRKVFFVDPITPKWEQPERLEFVKLAGMELIREEV